MCGIAGQYCYSTGIPDRKFLADMSMKLTHRGPDGEGSYIDNNIGLVHRRLAIIDLSPEGHQPMTNEDRSLWLVFNGEIYNFVELREELVRYGHTFHSKSDTEVILHAYEEWGHECLNRFNGMWAFALWDTRKQELFCARDRFGIKPFYYANINGSFLFASEIKALLTHPKIQAIPEDHLLCTYLKYGVQDHSSKTMFKEIFQLKPSHAVIVSRQGIQPQFQYWDVTINPEIKKGSEHTPVSTSLATKLIESIKIHLRSDVAIGTCLSGGIDSTAVTVLINTIIKNDAPESVGTRQKTFSVVFSNKKFDESKYIDEVIATTGVDADKTEPSPEQIREDIHRLIYMQDEPFGSLSIYAQYCVMRLAQKKVKVVLDGQGADELLAGYLGYQASYIQGLVRKYRWWTAFCEMFGSFRNHHGFFIASQKQIRIRKRRRGLVRCNSEPINRYNGSLDEVLHRELLTTNLPALLHYEDRNSMAFSLESRVPYLDVRLVEYIASLPLSEKIRDGTTKVALRSALKGLIPESIRCRRDKMGFVTPEECWMKDDLRTFMLDIFSSSSFKSRPYWDADVVMSDYQNFLEERTSYSPEIWRIACAELWLRTFIDGSTAK